MPLVTRTGKGSQLTTAEMDANLQYLEGLGAALPPVTITVSTALTQADHANRLLICNSASPIILTVQTDAVGGFSGDDSITALVYGTGSVTISSPGSPLIQTPANTLGTGTIRYSLIAVTRIGANEWTQTEKSASASSGGSYKFSEQINYCYFPAIYNNGQSFTTGNVSKTGTATYPTPVYPGTELTSRNREQLLGTTAASNSVIYAANGNISNFGNRYVFSEFIFGIEDAMTSGGTVLCGFAGQTTTHGDAVPSNLNSPMVFVGADAGDTQLFVMYKATSGGTATKVAINGGTGFLSNPNADSLYKVLINYYPAADVGGRRWTVSVTNMLTSVTAATINIADASGPPLTQSIVPGFGRNNGSTGIAANLHIVSMTAGVFNA